MKREREQDVRRVAAPDRILSYFKREKGKLALVTVTGILYNLGLVAGPWFEGQLAQRLLDVLNANKTLSDMAALAGLYVLVTAFVQLMRCIKRLYVRKFCNAVNRSMKHVLYANLLHQDRAALMREGAGSVMTKAVSDADACAEGMRKFTTEVFDTGVAIVAYLAMLLYYDWRLTLLCGLFPPIAYVLAEKMKFVVQRNAAAWRESAASLSAATLDRAAGAIPYRVFGCEQERDAAYEKRLSAYERAAVRANIWVAAMPPIYQILSLAGVLFIGWIGVQNVRHTGFAAWDIAAFTTYLACYARLAVKSSKAAKLFNSVQQAQVSWKRIRPLLHETAPDEDVPAAAPAELTVTDLSFAYPDGRQVLSDVTFSANAGEIVGVTGPVACGKSTLGKAFLCESPYVGSIRFGGAELKELPAAIRTGVVGYMGHDAELISDTVKTNVLLGDEADVWPFLAAVCIDGEVRQMPEGADTPVGAGGVRLSGGQRQRLALARLMCHKRPVMVLDDPFSAVDMATEREILKNLRALAPDSVILLISHRLSLFSEFDRVLWMEDGRVTQSDHRTLLRENDRYAALCRAQAEGGRAT